MAYDESFPSTSERIYRNKLTAQTRCFQGDQRSVKFLSKRLASDGIDSLLHLNTECWTEIRVFFFTLHFSCKSWQPNSFCKWLQVSRLSSRCYRILFFYSRCSLAHIALQGVVLHWVAVWRWQTWACYSIQQWIKEIRDLKSFTC